MSSPPILLDATHIRLRAGMYIGDTGQRGLHHLVLELVHNAIDEARAGHGTRIEIDLLADGGCRVTDSGRGIPVDQVDGSEEQALESVFTGEWIPDPVKPVPRLACGPGGCGLLAVNALSHRLLVEVRRAGLLWRQEYSRGEPVTPLRSSRPARTTGTTITFWPDPDIFTDSPTFSFVELHSRLRELAACNAGLDVRLRDHRLDPPLIERCCFANGLAGYLDETTRSMAQVHPTILHATTQTAQGRAEVALRWHHLEHQRTWAHANGIFTEHGGTHVTGFRAALTRTVRAFLQSRAEVMPAWSLPAGYMIRAGLVAILSVDLPEPMWGGATRSRLNSPEAEGLIHSLTRRCLETFLRDHADEAEAIVRHLVAPCPVDARTGLPR